MEQEYKIKGIKKILDKLSKEDLARFYKTDVNADFEKILTEYFKSMGIPNNSEVALYVALSPKEYNKRREEYKTTEPQNIASEFYKNDERKRALYGISYGLGIPEFDENAQLKSGTYGNVIYFGVDEPIAESDLANIFPSPRYFCGGVHYNTLLMGNKYFEEHEDELKQAFPSRNKMEAVDSYIQNFVNEFENVEYTEGYGPRPEYTETDEIRQKKQESEKIILDLTGKSSIDELSLRDFIKLKRRLEQEEKDLRKAFEEKFTKKDEETKE